MAFRVGPIDLGIPIEAAPHSLADFSRTAEWDPGVCAVRSHPLLSEGVA